MWLQCAAAAGAWLFAYGSDRRPGGNPTPAREPAEVWCHYMHSCLLGDGSRKVDNVYQYSAFSASLWAAAEYIHALSLWEDSSKAM